MNAKEKAAWLWLLSVLGMIVVLLLGAIILPPAMRERSKISSLRSLLNEKSLEETKAKKLFEDVSRDVELFKTEVDDIRGKIAQSRFRSRSETEIPAFIDELQKILGSPGLTLKQIAYQKRTTDQGFVTLPFDCELEATYPAFRAFIGTIENHPVGLRIDQLEFVRLDNEHHALQLRLKCSARFKANG